MVPTKSSQLFLLGFHLQYNVLGEARVMVGEENGRSRVGKESVQGVSHIYCI